MAEQNNEMERLEEQIAALKEEETKFEQESGEDAIQHKQLISDLETRLVSTKTSAEKYESRFTEAQKTVSGSSSRMQCSGVDSAAVCVTLSFVWCGMFISDQIPHHWHSIHFPQNKMR